MDKLPSRRQGGLTLSYDSGDLFVTFFGYNASLMAASNEGFLQPNNVMRDDYELNTRQQQIVDEWMDRYDDYFEANGWATWEEANV